MFEPINITVDSSGFNKSVDMFDSLKPKGTGYRYGLGVKPEVVYRAMLKAPAKTRPLIEKAIRKFWKEELISKGITYRYGGQITVADDFELAEAITKDPKKYSDLLMVLKI